METVLAYLVKHRFEPAVQATISQLRGAATVGSSAVGAKELAYAAATLLQLDFGSVWSTIKSLCESNIELASSIFQNISLVDLERRDTMPFYAGLAESEIGELFVLLFKHFPKHPETRNGRARFVTDFDRLDHLRAGLLRYLVYKGTLAAVEAIEYLVRGLPDETWLRLQLIDARRSLSERSWKKVRPSQVIAQIAACRPVPRPESVITRLAAAEQDAARFNVLPTGPPDQDVNPVEAIDLPDNTRRVSSELRSMKVLVLGTEWTSAHGGLSTIN